MHVATVDRLIRRGVLRPALAVRDGAKEAGKGSLHFDSLFARRHITTPQPLRAGSARTIRRPGETT